MTEYETIDDEPVPEQVAEQFAHPDDWEMYDPMNVGRPECLWADLYHGVEEGSLERVYFDERGNVYDPERFETMAYRLDPDTLPRTHMTKMNPFTYNESPDVIDHDHFREHVTRVMVVFAPGERVKLNSRDGVCWFDHRTLDAPEEAIEIAVALSETRISGELNNCEPSDSPSGKSGCGNGSRGDPAQLTTPDGFEKVVGGWHDSMTSSEQSRTMNALATGNVPPELSDDAFPYAVKLGDTKNCCSQPASLYADVEVHDELKALFEGKKSVPTIGGGFR